MTLRGWEDARGGVDMRADVVIVGTGPGGAAAAKTLALGGADVVMIEAGPARPRFRPNQAHTNRYHMQEAGMMVARGTGMMPVAAGRGVGGGSLVNSAICFRTPDHVLDRWIELLGGDSRFAPSRLAEVFDELEAILGIDTTPEEIAGENNLIIARGAEKLGLPGGLVRRNAPGCVGCGVCNFGCPVGGKASVDRNLIPMARGEGAIVQADTRVDEILIEGGRAVGVVGTARHTDTRDEVGRVVVRADRVVLSCGAIGTPRLLHGAGLAERLGPAVGKGLHVHPGNAVMGICDHDVHMWKGATQGAYFEDPALPGVLPHTFTAPPAVIVMTTGKVGMEAKDALARIKHFCGCLVMVSDHGDGSVGATADGRADIRYWFDDGDVQTVKKALVRAGEVLLAGGARQVFAPVHGTGIYDDLGEFEAALADRTIDDFTLYSSHPMASCRIGVDPDTSVVGPDGAAHRLPGLYLADSSVFPTSLGVNPQLTTMAVATVIAEGILDA